MKAGSMTTTILSTVTFREAIWLTSGRSVTTCLRRGEGFLKGTNQFNGVTYCNPARREDIAV